MVQQNVPKVYYNQRAGNGDDELSQKWWKCEPEKAYMNIWQLVNTICMSQSRRHTKNHEYYTAYCNEQLDYTRAGQFVNERAASFGHSGYTTFNVIKACVDTARAKISKHKPRPFFMTTNGDWFMQQKAQRLNSFILSLFDQIGPHNGLIRESIYNIGAEAFFDACITGTGASKMTIKNKEIVAERFLSDELIVDNFEGMYRTPRGMYHIKFIDREVLYDTYKEGKYRAIIEAARAATRINMPSTQDMVPVIEAYHLPSGPEAKDGKRAVILETGTIHWTDWDKPYFPYLVQRWGLKPIGYFGMGLAAELEGIQYEINYLLANIQTGLRRVAVPRVFHHISDLNATKRMTNRIGEHHFYQDRPPTFVTPQAFNMETYMHLDRLYGKAFEITGISQLAATAKKPSGLDSAVALREYNDSVSERFALVHQMYENYFTPQATYMVLDLLDELLEAGINVTVQAKDGITLQPVKYSDVKLPKKAFEVRPYATNYLPEEPAGRFAKVTELVTAGYYDQDEGHELLDFPDLQKSKRLKLAMRRGVQAYIEKMIDTGVYLPVEPYMDLGLTQKLSQAYYLEGRANGMPESRLDLLRRVMAEVKARTEQIQAQAAQAQAAMMGPAQAEVAQPAQDIQEATAEVEAATPMIQ